MLRTRRFKMNKKSVIVGVGGTFDELHKGHSALLKKAFEVGDTVLIGLSTDFFAEKLNKKHENAKYIDRRNVLVNYLIQNNFLTRAKIIPLNDPYGPTITNNHIDALVVSEETEPVSKKINDIRKNNGMTTLKIFVVKMIPAEDNKAISTTRIKNLEIDRNGHLLNIGAY